jgi:hypothetical protein
MQLLSDYCPNTIRETTRNMACGQESRNGPKYIPQTWLQQVLRDISAIYIGLRNIELLDRQTRLHERVARASRRYLRDAQRRMDRLQEEREALFYPFTEKPARVIKLFREATRGDAFNVTPTQWAEAVAAEGLKDFDEAWVEKFADT